ncbi:SpoVA/SpoVAEb family sporulation membrane protein [Alkalicoccobacillus porphyridii]|nr:SpoVA/SpoVAEb family sporulation membrane protein [Alkalicoccobacillus porphyridii]
MTKLKQKQYQKNIEIFLPKRQFFRNGTKAFLVGGAICVIGQGLIELYHHIFLIERQAAVEWMLVTLILAASVMTGFGLYRKTAAFSGAGILVPITGLVNLMTSSAMDHRHEGIIQGAAAHLLKLAGTVLVTGVVMAYVASAVRLIIHTIIK